MIGKSQFQTFDVATATTVNQDVPLTVKKGSELRSAYLAPAALSEGPVTAQLQLSKVTGSTITGVQQLAVGVARSDAVFAYDPVFWSGNAPIETEATQMHIVASVRNDTGSTVSMVLAWTWDEP